MALTVYHVGDGYPYTSIMDGINAIPGNLAGKGEHRVCVHAGGSHEGEGYFYDEAVDMNGGFVGETATDFVSLYAMVSHKGLRDHGIVVRAPGNGPLNYAIRTAQFGVVVGFCVTFDAPSTVLNRSLRAIYRNNQAGLLDRCIIYDAISTNGVTRAYGVYAPTGLPAITTAQLRNLIVTNIQSTERSAGIYVGSNAANRVYNCSVHNVGGTGVSHNGIRLVGTDNAVAKNCIATGCKNKDFQTAGCNPTVEYCISLDDTADDEGGPGNQINKDPLFKSTVLGNEDLHLQPGSCARDAGVDLSSEGFNEDTDGYPRPFGSRWDIGADEWIPAGITPDLGWDYESDMFDPLLNSKLTLLELEDLDLATTEVTGKYRIRGNITMEIEGVTYRIPDRVLDGLKDGVTYIYWFGDTRGEFTLVGHFLSEDEKRRQRVFDDTMERVL